MLMYYFPQQVQYFIDILSVVTQTRFFDCASILCTLLKERLISERGLARNRD